MRGNPSLGASGRDGRPCPSHHLFIKVYIVFIILINEFLNFVLE